MNLPKASLLIACQALIACSSDPLPEAETGTGGAGGSAEAGQTGRQDGGATEEGSGGSSDVLPRCESTSPAALRPLSPREYRQTLLAVFGPAAAAATPVPDQRAFRFDTQDATSALSDAFIEQMVANAKALARSFATSGTAASCGPAAALTSSCANSVIDELGPRLLKRPVADAERATMLALFERTRARAGGAAAIEGVVASLLLSPSFVFHIAEGDTAVQNSDRRWLTPHELAHRLAYAVWGEPADQELLRTTAVGNLSTPEGLQTTVDLMLADPRAQAGVIAFYSQWLRFNRLQDRDKDPKRYPQWNQTLINEAVNEANHLVTNNFFSEQGSLAQLLNSRKALVGPNLASVYGVRAQAAETPVELPEGERAGILTRVAFLASHSGSIFSSPSGLGVALINGLLCANLPPPPANVELIELDIAVATLTRRQAFERSLAANPNCGDCHKMMDPLGFPFDGYNAIGARQTTDNGQPIDTTGSLALHLDGRSFVGSWNNSVELSRWLSLQTDVRKCAADKYWQYISGLPDGEQISCTEHRLHKANASGSMKNVAVAALTDESFQQVPASLKPSNNVTTKPLPEADTAFEAVLSISADAFAALKDRLSDENERRPVAHWQQQLEELRRRLRATSP